MLLTEYDEEKHMKTVFREGVEEGKQIGYSEGEQVGYSKGRQSLLEEMISRKLKKGKTPEQIAEELEVDIEIIREYIKK